MPQHLPHTGIPTIYDIFNQLFDAQIPRYTQAFEKLYTSSAAASTYVLSPRKSDSEAGLKKRPSRARIMMFLSIAYSANNGGTATLTGSGVNIFFKGLLDDISEDNPVTFGSWLLFSIPLMVSNMVGTYSIPKLCQGFLGGGASREYFWSPRPFPPLPVAELGVAAGVVHATADVGVLLAQVR